MFTKM